VLTRVHRDSIPDHHRVPTPCISTIHGLQLAAQDMVPLANLSSIADTKKVRGVCPLRLQYYGILRREAPSVTTVSPDFQRLSLLGMV